VWIRIDLPRESTICRLALVEREPAVAGDPKQGDRVWDDANDPSELPGRALPEKLKVKLSRDAWHWETVFAGPAQDLEHVGWRHEVKFTPQRAKQIWVIGESFPRVENFGHCFSIAGLEVIDEAGRNLALATQGAGVTVSSTHYGLGDERESHENLWGVHWDLGLKWVRVGYHDDPVNWHSVERDKGKYYVDPLAERAIDDCIANGVNVVISLGFGNWLYTKEGVRPWRDFYHEQYYDLAPAPVDAAPRKAFLKFVRFLVGHFGDRVKHWELWNEWNCPGYWAGRHAEPDVEAYLQLARSMIPAVKSECPDAKLILGSTGGWYGSGGKLREWILRTIDELGADVDIIGFHPLYAVDPGSEPFRNYASTFQEFKDAARGRGFTGDFRVTEWTLSAPYPERGPRWCTEMVKAKAMATTIVMHTGSDIVSFWNETWQGHVTHWDVGLMRNTFSADPHSPRQPQPAYYVMRTLATVLDSLMPTEIPVKITGTSREYQVWGFATNGEKVLAVWLAGTPGDGAPSVKANVAFLADDFSRAVGADIMNGTEQELTVCDEDGRKLLKGLLLQDWPVVVRLLP